MVLDYGLAKFNQLLNLFSLESREIKRTAQRNGFASWEDQTTAQHLCSWEAQTTDQLFRSWVLINSNNCWTVLDSGLAKFKQLPNNCGLGMRKKLHNKLVWGSSNTCSTFCSWEAQTTDQLFRSWVLINSNNCWTVLDSGLGKNQTTAQHLWSWDAQTVAQQVSLGKFKHLLNILFLGSSNNWPTVSALSLDKFKPLPNGFGFGSWEVQTNAQFVFLRSLSRCPKFYSREPQATADHLCS